MSIIGQDVFKTDGRLRSAGKPRRYQLVNHGMVLFETSLSLPFLRLLEL
jgi:hypothetical protein